MSALKFKRNSAAEEAAIKRGIAADPVDAAEMSGDEVRSLKRMGRPPKANPKKATSIRYDQDVLEAFQATGSGWQTRMNDALRTYLQEHPL